jgi:hypothetical protein
MLQTDAYLYDGKLRSQTLVQATGQGLKRLKRLLWFEQEMLEAGREAGINIYYSKNVYFLFFQKIEQNRGHHKL